MTQTQPVGRAPGAEQYPLEATTLDVTAYTDPHRFEREITEIFPMTWFPVCPAADVAEPRSLFVWEQLRQSVVVVRQDDGSVVAWHNVCQHRGAHLIEESGRCPAGKIKCPWHGFVYDLQGRVTSVPLRETFDERELDGLAAPQVRVEEWSGLIWLTLSEGAPPLREYLGEVGDELAGYGLERFTPAYRQAVTLSANWKIVVDAFNETWHVPFTHKDTLSGLVMWRDAALKICDPHSWMTLPVRGLTDRSTSDDHRQSHLCHYLVFPNTIFSCFPTHLQMWTAWPKGPEETELIAYHLLGPSPKSWSDSSWREQNERSWNQFIEVLGEDTDVINNFAKVIHSRGLERVMFNTAESRLTAFHREVARRVGGPEPK